MTEDDVAAAELWARVLVSDNVAPAFREPARELLAAAALIVACDGPIRSYSALEAALAPIAALAAGRQLDEAGSRGDDLFDTWLSAPELPREARVRLAGIRARGPAERGEILLVAYRALQDPPRAANAG